MMEYAYGVPSYLRCSVCGNVMMGEASRKDKSKFHVWCASIQCPESNIKYATDAPAYKLEKVEDQ